MRSTFLSLLFLGLLFFGGGCVFPVCDASADEPASGSGASGESPASTAVAESGGTDPMRELSDDMVRKILPDYVARPDESFRWTVRQSGTLGVTEYRELTLTSQTWREIPWKHQLFLLKPSNAPADCRQALLYITGGRWDARLEQPPESEQLPREARSFAILAEVLATPVAVLLQVPQQPLFDGKYEDAIIALTFEQYLRTGESDWPLLLPMVKSAVRGMDATQQAASQFWNLDLKNFTVTGASKRGWTTWLTGAVDQRANALAPMVIDVLNMEHQMKHQQKVWGKFSEEINDYTERNLQERLSTPAGRSLRQIVDPYQYRDSLTQPKLIVIGTNDPYWPLDALNLYWQDLHGPKYVLYVPNNEHGLKDMGRVTGSLNALHQHVTNGFRLPNLQWDLQRKDDRLHLTVTSDRDPRAVSAWIAQAKTRDFRPARWESQPMRKQENRWHYELPIPDDGYVALFGEALYDGLAMPYYLSTNVRIETNQALAGE